MPWFWGNKAEMGESDEEEEYSSSDEDDDRSNDDDDEEESLEGDYEDDEEESLSDYDTEEEEHEDEHYSSSDEDNEEDKLTKPQNSASSRGYFGWFQRKTKSPPDEVDNKKSINGNFTENAQQLEPLKTEVGAGSAEASPRKNPLHSNSERPSLQSLGGGGTISISDDDVSMIDSEGLRSEDEKLFDNSNSCSQDGDHMFLLDNRRTEETFVEGMNKVSTTETSDTRVQLGTGESTTEQTKDTYKIATANEEDVQVKADEDDNDEPTTFWEKQSLLMLAAEHDRVDILRGILSEPEDQALLIDSGIPPLHLAISYGSVNTTQSLLRMGADPSIRPNVEEVKEHAKEAPEGQKLEIPNINRFDGVTAWELAFGNSVYGEQQQSRSKWSIFNSSSSNLSQHGGDSSTRIIRPVDMAPSKREGIRHAFTAEALRCIGGDEVNRLGQLLDSGMPASVDVGGKDLYEWAVQLGGLKCEELLRPVEAMKYESSQFLEDVDLNSVSERFDPSNKESEAIDERIDSDFDDAQLFEGKVLDRPGMEMTVPLLRNRLNELESLAAALGTCLDNLAEEVSVCHGLLLMGGGASALASHVRSLKNLQAQRREQLKGEYEEYYTSGENIAELLKIAGSIGEEVTAMSSQDLRQEGEKFSSHREDGADDDIDDAKDQQQLLAQITASESKILKLRASIADLSEERAKEMKQVEERGLAGGITLMRKLRDELQELDFQLSETRKQTETQRLQIRIIKRRMPNAGTMRVATVAIDVDRKSRSIAVAGGQEEESPHTHRRASVEVEKPNQDKAGSVIRAIASTTSSQQDVQSIDSDYESESDDPSSSESEQSFDSELSGGELERDDKSSNDDHGDHHSKASNGNMAVQIAAPKAEVIARSTSSIPTPKPGHVKPKVESERATTGDSQALIARPKGNRGLFPLDLWQVLLRIVGFNQAAARRAVQNASSQKKKQGAPANLMIV